MVNTKEDFEKEIVALEKEKEDCEEKEEKLGERITQQYVALETATKKLEEQLEAIKNPFHLKIKELGKEKEKFHDRAWRIPLDIRDIKNKMSLIGITEHDVDSVVSFLALKRIIVSGDSRFGRSTCKLKKVLDNGLRIFAINNESDDYNMWLAFNKLDLVGICVRRKGKHAGDETTPYTFIGDTDKAIRAKKKRGHCLRFHSKDCKEPSCMIEANAGYREMEALLDKIDLKKAKPIDFDEKNIRQWSEW